MIQQQYIYIFKPRERERERERERGGVFYIIASKVYSKNI